VAHGLFVVELMTLENGAGCFPSDILGTPNDLLMQHCCQHLPNIHLPWLLWQWDN